MHYIRAHYVGTVKNDVRDLKKSMKTIALYMNTLDEKVTTINDFTSHLGAQTMKNNEAQQQVLPFKTVEEIMTYSIKGDMTILRLR